MFGRLVQKEIAHHLLDFRFISVFGICALLSALSVYTGSRNYARQLQNYGAVSESARKTMQGWLEQGNLFEFMWSGYTWVRKPEALSPVVYGLSGTQGQEAGIQYERLPAFGASLFETDPIYALFGVLDLGFIVKFVLTLAVLLFTYDTVCGEKEAGTLRLYASFPISRSKLALAKLVGSTAAVLVPFAFAFLLAAAVLALSPDVVLTGDTWARLGALMGVFALYLAVFAAFGLFISALTHRRLTAFLGLLGLWTVWLFVAPNLAVRTARALTPATSLFEVQRQASKLRWELLKERRVETRAYWEQNRVENWDALSDAQKRELLDGDRRIEEKWDRLFQARLLGMQAGRRNQMRQQQRLAALLSAVSPMGAASFVSMDLARTGFVQQERMEDAPGAYLTYLAGFIRQKQAEVGDRETLTDFAPFAYRDTEPLGACLSRNVLYILNLALLALLGFAGAYVAILRYDVR